MAELPNNDQKLYMLNPVLANLDTTESGVESRVSTLETEVAAAQSSLNTVASQTITGATLDLDSSNVLTSGQLSQAGTGTINVTINKTE